MLARLPSLWQPDCVSLSFQVPLENMLQASRGAAEQLSKLLLQRHRAAYVHGGATHFPTQQFTSRILHM